MCGIAGILSHSEPLPEPSGLAQMLRAQKHRGPDDTGSFRTATLELGMLRLSILDLRSPNLCPIPDGSGSGSLCDRIPAIPHML